MASVELEQLARTYPRGIVGLHPLDLEVAAGEFLVVLGPSGSGKSTLLRLIAGLDPPSGGRVRIGGLDVTDLPPHERGVGLVFQRPALLPHLTVLGNLAFPLRARGLRRDQAEARAREVARQLEIEPLLARRPGTLSGGELQRVAIGRAVAPKPRLLMLDEPFSNLDPLLRAVLRQRVAQLHREQRTTTILVTHDQQEAMSLADRVAILFQGRLHQCSDPRTIYTRPADRATARFVGSPVINTIFCTVKRQQSGLRLELSGLDDTAAWTRPAGSSCQELQTPDQIELGLRPEQIEVVSEEAPISAPGSPWTSAVVASLEYLGSECIARLRCASRMLTARVPAESRLRVGDRVRAVLAVERGVWFNLHGQAIDWGAGLSHSRAGTRVESGLADGGP